MKATIKFPAIGQESYWQKGDDGKAVCRITVTGEDGKDYKVRIQEGTPEWAKVKGDTIGIELRANKSTGEQYAVLEGTPQSAPRQGGGNFAPRKTYTAKEVASTADLAARMSVYVFCTIKDELQKKGVTDATAEDVRTMTNTVVMKLIERLP